jgi:hypothetical protein
MTTRAFAQSLIWWQKATVYAMGGPNPIALLPPVSIDEADVDLVAAKEWVAAIETLLANVRPSIAEAEAREGESVEVLKWKTVLKFIESAHRSALEHVASFGPGAPMQGQASR